MHHICEVQLNVERLLQAKEQGHVVYEQIRVELPKLCPGDWGKMDKIQRFVVSELDAPRPLGGYFGSLRTVRAAGLSETLVVWRCATQSFLENKHAQAALRLAICFCGHSA